MSRNKLMRAQSLFDEPIIIKGRISHWSAFVLLILAVASIGLYLLSIQVAIQIDAVRVQSSPEAIRFKVAKGNLRFFSPGQLVNIYYAGDGTVPVAYGFAKIPEMQMGIERESDQILIEIGDSNTLNSDGFAFVLKTQYLLVPRLNPFAKYFRHE